MPSIHRRCTQNTCLLFACIGTSVILAGLLAICVIQFSLPELSGLVAAFLTDDRLLKPKISGLLPVQVARYESARLFEDHFSAVVGVADVVLRFGFGRHEQVLTVGRKQQAFAERRPLPKDER